MWHGQEDTRYAYRVLVGETKGKNHLEEISLDGKIILQLALKEIRW